MSLNLKQKITHNFLNIQGWHTNRKIVVIESDDWGSIRMPSKEVYNSLVKAGINIKDDPYNKYDSLASEEDLAFLFEVLSSFKDKNGNSPVITANCVVANPDFEKIKASGYGEYHYELVTDTLKRYPCHADSFNLWKEGNSNKIFHPQFHGREHVHVERWLTMLQKNNKSIKIAFDLGLFGLVSPHESEIENNCMVALDYETIQQKDLQAQSIIDGLNIFEQLFSYRSKSFIAPSYTWHSDLNQTLKQAGIDYLQGISYQDEPNTDNNINRRIFHYTGQKNKYGQSYLVRNCHFEPSQSQNSNNVDDCLHRMSIAFRWHKPAIISSHRLNFIGFIDPKNRDRNLPLLAELLKEILKRWPDVEFMSSDQLGELMENKS
ncbi:MAG: hypothetical protein GZ094_23580 [Mariniphaga sp.]|nr:hypothetical protein [Mariniphaga sp.]